MLKSWRWCRMLPCSRSRRLCCRCSFVWQLRCWLRADVRCCPSVAAGVVVGAGCRLSAAPGCGWTQRFSRAVSAGLRSGAVLAWLLRRRLCLSGWRGGYCCCCGESCFCCMASSSGRKRGSSCSSSRSGSRRMWSVSSNPALTASFRCSKALSGRCVRA